MTPSAPNATLSLPHIDVPAPTGVGPACVRFSLPLPPSALTPGAPLALADPDARVIALQTRPLALWPDGSVRWLDCLASLDQAGALQVVKATAAPPTNPARALETAAGGVILDNGIVAVELTAHGPSPISRIRFQDRDVAHPQTPLEAYVVAARTGRVFTSAASTDRTVRLLESGPVRAVAEITGRYAAPGNGEIMAWRLRVELAAGQAQIVLRYRFTHADPRIPFHALSEIGLRLRWAEAKRFHAHQCNHGMTWLPRDIITDQPLDIRATADCPRPVASPPASLADATAYPEFMPPADTMLPLLGAQLPNGWVTAYVDDFIELSPTGLSAAGDAIAVQVWPAWAGALELPQGRSRETALALLFTPGDAPPPGAAARARATDALNAPRAVVPQAWYQSCRCFHADQLLPRVPDAADPVDRSLRALADLPTVVGMWDLGDTIDPGYSRTYVPTGRLKRLSAPRPFFEAVTHYPLADWSHTLLYEPVWTNNEYDALLALCQELLRGGGSPELWRRIGWFTRHAVDVDFVAFSDHPEQHHGTPAHSADHRKAAAYPSHLWCEGLLASYCLTGDDDALDVAIKQGDFILRTFADPARRAKLWHFSRELGWALLHLAALADLTREARFLQAARELAAALTAEPLTDDLARTMTESSFGFASIALGVEALWRIENRPDLAEWIIALSSAVGRCVAAGQTSRESAMTLCYFNAAWVVSGDAAHIRAGMPVLRRMMQSGAWTAPPRFAKPMAMTYRGLSRFAKAACELGLLDDAGHRRRERRTGFDAGAAPTPVSQCSANRREEVR